MCSRTARSRAASMRAAPIRCLRTTATANSFSWPPRPIATPGTKPCCARSGRRCKRRSPIWTSCAPRPGRRPSRRRTSVTYMACCRRPSVTRAIRTRRRIPTGTISGACWATRTRSSSPKLWAMRTPPLAMRRRGISSPPTSGRRSRRRRPIIALTGSPALRTGAISTPPQPPSPCRRRANRIICRPGLWREPSIATGKTSRTV